MTIPPEVALALFVAGIAFGWAARRLYSWWIVSRAMRLRRLKLPRA